MRCSRARGCDGPSSVGPAVNALTEPQPGAVDQACSASWRLTAEDDRTADVVPRIAVLIPTYERPSFLPTLFAALEAQELPIADFEVVLVDDASSDETWAVLVELVTRCRLQALAIRHDRNRGPAAARNRAAASSSAPILAFTDDDCLPSPAWLSSLLEVFDGDADVVQGRVTPPPDDWARARPWDHTIWVQGPSPFFETCNVAYRRRDFEQVGGFDDSDPLLTPEEGRGFGEDAELAARVLRHGGERAFAPTALVHHRCVDREFREVLRMRRYVVGFPGLARRSPIFSRWLRSGLFLSSRSAAFDLMVLATWVAAGSRRFSPLVGALPWVWIRGHDALSQTRGDRVRAIPVLAQLGLLDAVTLVSLVEGSLRHRRAVL